RVGGSSRSRAPGAGGTGNTPPARSGQPSRPKRRPAAADVERSRNLRLNSRGRQEPAVVGGAALVAGLLEVVRPRYVGGAGNRGCTAAPGTASARLLAPSRSAGGAVPSPSTRPGCGVSGPFVVSRSR